MTTPCGTTAQYQQHVKNGEPVDDACRDANRSYHAQYRAQNPERVIRALATSRARGAALGRLAEMYPQQYEQLLAQERTSQGLPPARGAVAEPG